MQWYWSVYFDLHNGTSLQMVVYSARAQDFQVRPPRKLYLVVTTDRAINQAPNSPPETDKTVNFCVKVKLAFIFTKFASHQTQIQNLHQRKLLPATCFSSFLCNFFSSDCQNTSRTRRKMSTVTITTPASTLRLSPLRVEDLLQGAIMLI